MVPGLAVVLVGEDPASQVYVRNKAAACEKAGLHSQVIRLAADISEEQLLDMVRDLNRDDTVHGILVQLPLPKHMNSSKVIEAIRSEEHTSELQSLMRISYAVFCLKKKK